MLKEGEYIKTTRVRRKVETGLGSEHSASARPM
jgi:hypothetical protein